MVYYNLSVINIHAKMTVLQQETEKRNQKYVDKITTPIFMKVIIEKQKKENKSLNQYIKKEEVK